MSFRWWAPSIASWFVAAIMVSASPASFASEFDLLLLNGFEECALAYPDADLDTFGSAFGVASRCDPLPAGFVRRGGDCSDFNSQINIGIVENQPDAAFDDENCDGVDGNVNLAVFVSVGGAAALPCGTRAAPCALAIAPAAAVAAGKVQLYLTTGSHQGPLDLSGAGATLRVFGGYSDLFRVRAPVSVQASTEILGAPIAAIGVYAVQAGNGALLNLADLRLVSPGATGQTPGGDAHSSYGARVLAGATLTAARVEIVAGSGAPGPTGAAGLSASVLNAQPSMHGSVGGNGEEFATQCNNSLRGAGGPRGTNTCPDSPSTRDMDAGTGGAGGTMDTDCSVFGSNFNARPGDNGLNADFASGSNGQGGLGGSGGDACGPTTNGVAGIAADGIPGNAAPGFTINGDLVIARSGTGGGTGLNGSGGGGGGGSGGCDQGTDAYGPGGGGGGAGGCAARPAGSGGRGGGASIGIFVVGATLTTSNTRIATGVGGAGGTGGTGGTGQAPGLGQAGGANPGTAIPGRGGDGAPGGHSGGGGGGTGGSSFGVLGLNAVFSGTPPVITIGTRGAGGAGGGAGTPAATGQAGSDGEQAAQRVCAAAGNC